MTINDSTHDVQLSQITQDSTRSEILECILPRDTQLLSVNYKNPITEHPIMKIHNTQPAEEEQSPIRMR